MHNDLISCRWVGCQTYFILVGFWICIYLFHTDLFHLNYDKRDDFDFGIIKFPFLDGDVPHSTSYGVYISQLIRFAIVCSHVADFNARYKSLTAKLVQQGYRYHKLRKTFSKFYRRRYELVSKFNVGLITLLHQGLSEPEFYGDLLYKFKIIVGRANFSDQFNVLNIMRQSACLVVYPITVNNCSFPL